MSLNERTPPMMRSRVRDVCENGGNVLTLGGENFQETHCEVVNVLEILVKLHEIKFEATKSRVGGR